MIWLISISSQGSWCSDGHQARSEATQSGCLYRRATGLFNKVSGHSQCYQHLQVLDSLMGWVDFRPYGRATWEWFQLHWVPSSISPLPVWVRTLCAESQVGNYLGFSRKLKVIYSYNIWTCFWSFTIQHFQTLLVWTGLPSRLSTRLLIEPIFFSMCEWFRGYLPGRIVWFLEQLDWSRI